MKVAYLVNRYPAASHTFIRREIRALEEAGVQVTRFSIRRFGDDVTDREDKVEAERTRAILDVGALGLVLSLLGTALTRPVRLMRAIGVAVRIGWKSDRGLLRHLAYVAETCVLMRWLRQSGGEHLHAHFVTNSAAVAMFCRILGGPPYSFTAHGIEMLDRPEALGLREKVKWASFAVNVSEFGRGQLYRWCSRSDWAKLHVVRCGVNGRFLGGPPVALPAAARLVCVARLSEEKGHAVLLEAAHRLVAQGLDVNLDLVGDGPLRAETEALASRLGLQGRVHITGWADGDEVCRRVLNARALVLPSLAEGLPVVLMEALALGRPVISTYIGGIPELVQPGISGWLVPAGSVAALAAAMREVIEAPVERLEAMGRAGAARVAELHDVRKEAAKLAALFRNGTTRTSGE